MKSGQQWFEESRQLVSDIFGEDFDLFCRLLAATSPLTDVITNVSHALKVYRGIKLDHFISRSGLMHTHFVSVCKFLNGGTPGRKIWSLFQNMIGNEQPVTVDRWMVRYFGFDGLKSVSTELYDVCEARVVVMAGERGIPPAQMQAEIWTEARGDDTSYGSELKRLNITKENLLRRLI